MPHGPPSALRHDQSGLGGIQYFQAEQLALVINLKAAKSWELRCPPSWGACQHPGLVCQEGAYYRRLRGAQQAFRSHQRQVTVRTELIEVDAQKLRFKVEAHDGTRRLAMA